MLTLLRREHELSDTARQLNVLSQASAPEFAGTLDERRLPPLRASEIKILQVNVGRLCNQTCRHCHVDAGPERREVMARETLQACLDVLAQTEIPVVDITGGAPEMNPHFRWFVDEVHRLRRRVIDRCNLTILMAPGFEDLPEFLAERQVEVVASLPCYLEQNVDTQRGDGVFQKSMDALRRLNALGYGRELTLTLVFNPLGPSLPPPQAKLEADYRRELRKRHGVEFTRLITITNMPISRFLEDLLNQGKLEAYLEKLVNAFNPSAVEGLMCRNTLSVDWRGRLYDCDFNQMLDLGVVPSAPRTIFEFDAAGLVGRPIVTGKHCHGCTAGAGSSCQGAIV